jgi:hypothetical protein
MECLKIRGRKRLNPFTHYTRWKRAFKLRKHPVVNPDTEFEFTFTRCWQYDNSDTIVHFYDQSRLDRFG